LNHFEEQNDHSSDLSRFLIAALFALVLAALALTNAVEIQEAVTEALAVLHYRLAHFDRSR
jgi:hypothetical protein